jgi:DNA-binding CsgD family transcriptional regulator
MIFAWLLAVHGRALSAIGDQAALEALSEADQIAARANNPWLTALVKDCLGRLATRQANLHQAEDLHHHALALRHAHQLRPGVVVSLEALAGLAARYQSAAEAVRLFAAADTLRTVLGVVRWPTDQTGYDDDLGCARQQLDADAFTTAWAEGQALSNDEAVAYASRARGQRRRPSTGWSSLTPTETAVVELLAQGLTNPQIAERLFISRAIVKTHLIHIFNKLGVATRSQLAAQAARRAAVQ